LNAELEDRVRQRTLELRSSEERFRSLAESAPVGTFRTDARGRCSYVNPAWSELTGLSHEEAIDKGWVRMVHPEDQDRVLSSWGQAAGDAQHRALRRAGRVVLDIAKARIDQRHHETTRLFSTRLPVSPRVDVTAVRTAELRCRINKPDFPAADIGH